MAPSFSLSSASSSVRTVSILGSTGSIGRSTLDLIALYPHQYDVKVLTAYSNARLLIEQARRFEPEVVAVGEAAFREVKEALSGQATVVKGGVSGVVEAAAHPSNWVMAAIVGVSGLRPTLAAVQRGAIVALANKEALVAAGPYFMDQAKKCGATILPVDSEHNAIYQCFNAAHRASVKSVILTASGGPFRKRAAEDLAAVTPEEAAAHPNWDMGAKISIDCATLVNKGLEIIEAAYLFDLNADQIEVLVHPQSIVHSCVRYGDGSIMAQMGVPDMRTPISYCLAWPDRLETPVRPLDFAQVGALTFELPNPKQFPAVQLAKAALKEGSCAPIIFNAANEQAVRSFQAHDIKFTDIVPLIETALTRCTRGGRPSDLEAILAIDAEGRRIFQEICYKK